MLCFKTASDEKKDNFVTSIVLATNFVSEYDLSTSLYKHHNCMISLYPIYGHACIRCVNILKGRNTKCKDVHGHKN